MSFPIAQDTNHPVVDNTGDVAIFGNLIFDTSTLDTDEFSTEIPIKYETYDNELECFILSSDSIIPIFFDALLELEDQYYGWLFSLTTNPSPSDFDPSLHPDIDPAWFDPSFNPFESIPVYVKPEDEIWYELDQKFEQITIVFINNVVYTLGIGDPEVGEFVYDYELDRIRIKIDPETNHTVNLATIIKGHVEEVEEDFDVLPPGIVAESSNGSSYTDQYIIQQKVKKENPVICSISPQSLSLIGKWNADARITMSHQFQGHSSLSFTFTACKNEESEILKDLCNGTTFTALNYKWVIMNLTTTENTLNKTIVVNVSCQDALASRGNPSKSPLDKRVTKRKGGKRSYLSYRSVGEIARLSGVPYRGANIDFSVSRRASYEETVSVRELINNRAIITHGYVFYKGGVELQNRRWYSAKSHVLNRSQIRSPDITYSYSGHGRKQKGVKLHTEYRNLKIQRNFHPDYSESDQIKEGVTTRWSFTNCLGLGDMRVPATYNGASFRAPDKNVLSQPGLNADAGGITKSATQITEVNGTITFEVTYKWGYAFASTDTHNIYASSSGQVRITLKGSSPSVYWKLIEKTTTNYSYDGLGYLVKILKRGRSVARLLQETDNLEAAKTYAEGLVSRDTLTRFFKLNEAKGYEFSHNLPIYDITHFNLARFRSFFADTLQPGEACDPFWVEPKFVRRKTRLSRSSIIKENPRNTKDATYPPITTGKYLKEVETTTITKRSFPYKHEKRFVTRNSEGSRYKNSFASAKTTQVKGKPAMASRSAALLDHRRGVKIKKLILGPTEYYLSSAGVDNYSVVGGGANSSAVTIAASSGGRARATEGSKSYPDVSSPGQVGAIAKTELSIINTQNALTTSINIDRRPEMEVGDFLIFENTQWKIFSIQDELAVENGRVRSISYTIKIGKYLTPGTNVSSHTCRK